MRTLIALLGAACVLAAAASRADEAPDKAKQVCAACHGADGTGVAQFPDFPKLAGQRRDYLVQALKQYKSGARKNPIMGGMAMTLSPQDIDDLAAWFSAQKGTLFVTR
jgi:cytochrome c553